MQPGALGSEGETSSERCSGQPAGKAGSCSRGRACPLWCKTWVPPGSTAPAHGHEEAGNAKTAWRQSPRTRLQTRALLALVDQAAGAPWSVAVPVQPLVCRAVTFCCVCVQNSHLSGGRSR